MVFFLRAASCARLIFRFAAIRCCAVAILFAPLLVTRPAYSPGSALKARLTGGSFLKMYPRQERPKQRETPGQAPRPEQSEDFTSFESLAEQAVAILASVVGKASDGVHTVVVVVIHLVQGTRDATRGP